jgi:uncharacterized protein YuzB (UPF0349 family)
MAVGDLVGDIQSIAAGAYLDMQPAGTVEWIVHNVAHESDAALNRFDGTNSLDFDTQYGVGGWLGYFLHCGNVDRYRIKNGNTAAKLVAYDGVISHT